MINAQKVFGWGTKKAWQHTDHVFGFVPLDEADEDGMIRIEQMPDSEDGRKRGFLKSFKIYLKGVWYGKVLRTETDYPMLAVAEVADEGGPDEENE